MEEEALESTEGVENEAGAGGKPKNSADSNPCGMCRAFGLPICKGHSGGGGDSGGGGGSAADTHTDTQDKPFLPGEMLLVDQPSQDEHLDLANFLEASDVWLASEDNDLLYLLNNHASCVNLSLDLCKGSIKLEPNRLLSFDEEKDLEMLNSEILKELDEFKVEFQKEIDEQHINITGEVDSSKRLNIQIPNPKLFDAFISKLAEKNLIPTSSVDKALDKTATQEVNLAADNDMSKDREQSDESTYTTPNPLDISRGPTPPGTPKD